MPQDCRKPHKPQRVPLSLPTSQLRRGISDLEEELDILAREVPQGLETLRTRPAIAAHAKLQLHSSSPLLQASQAPTPPPLYSSTRSKVKRSGSCKVVPLFLAATIHAGVFFFTRKFLTIAVAPALVLATGNAHRHQGNQKKQRAMKVPLASESVRPAQTMVEADMMAG